MTDEEPPVVDITQNLVELSLEQELQQVAVKEKVVPILRDAYDQIKEILAEETERTGVPFQFNIHFSIVVGIEDDDQ